MSAKIISTKSASTIFSTNKINEVEINHDKKVEADSEFREVIKKGYLLNNINLSTIPDVIKDAIDKAILDAKNQTLADSLIETLKQSLENLDDGVYKKTYIDNMMTYVENLLTSKVNLETVASIADSKLAVALQDYASTTQVELLNSRVGNSESEITNIKETINTKDSARATQIEELEASIDDTFAEYSNAIDLYVDANGNVKSEKIEKLELGNYIQKVSINEENKIELDEQGNYTAISSKVILNSDGKIVGFKFTDTNDLTSFIINADVFKISNSDNSYTPFTIDENNILFNGKVTFSNVTGTDGIVTTSNLQTVIDSNVTIIDGGKIVTNAAFVNTLNATGGIIADNVRANDFYGKNFYGSYFEGARINGAVIKASYLDLDGQLEVLTNYHITVAMYNANPSLYTDAVYLAVDNEYRIPSLSMIKETTQSLTRTGTTGSLVGVLHPYNKGNAGNNLKAVSIRPTFVINNDVKLIYSTTSWNDNLFPGALKNRIRITLAGLVLFNFDVFTDSYSTGCDVTLSGAFFTTKNITATQIEYQVLWGGVTQTLDIGIGTLRVTLEKKVAGIVIIGGESGDKYVLEMNATLLAGDKTFSANWNDGSRLTITQSIVPYAATVGDISDRAVQGSSTFYLNNNITINNML